jgi:hypothetical protein
MELNTITQNNTQDLPTWIIGITDLARTIHSTAFSNRNNIPLLAYDNSTKGQMHDVKILLQETIKILDGISTSNTPIITPNSNSGIDQILGRILTRLDKQDALLNKLTNNKNTHPPTAQNYNNHANKSYAQVAAKTNPTPTKNTNASTHNPTTTQKPTSPRYVVRFHGNPPPFNHRLSNEKATKELNNRFQTMKTSQDKLTVAAVESKPSGNYVVTFAEGTPPNIAEAHKAQLKHALAQDHPDATVSLDIPWTKVLIHNVSTTNEEGYQRSQAELLDALLKNPPFKKAEITQNPRWLKDPEIIVHQKTSTIVTAFIDKNKNINTILNGSVHMFGSPVRVTLWHERPNQALCKRCWGWGHKQDNCKKPLRCRLCGKIGKNEHDHPKHCSQCAESSEITNNCNHVQCNTCGDKGHTVGDATCKKKPAGYRRSNHTPDNEHPHPPHPHTPSAPIHILTPPSKSPPPPPQPIQNVDTFPINTNSFALIQPDEDDNMNNEL